MQRDVASEKTMVQTGQSKAVSGKLAPRFDLVSPRAIRRLAHRLSVGAEKYGSVQWRMGINDEEYVRDRLNHLFDHTLSFMESGNTLDDNLGAMLWGCQAMVEVEALAPGLIERVVGKCNLFGEAAEAEHEREMATRAKREADRQLQQCINISRAGALKRKVVAKRSARKAA